MDGKQMANTIAEIFTKSLPQQGGALAQAKDRLIAQGGGADRIEYKVYVSQQLAKGLSPLPFKSWAIATLNSGR